MSSCNCFRLDRDCEKCKKNESPWDRLLKDAKIDNETSTKKKDKNI